MDSQQIAPINHIINVTMPQLEINITDHETSLRHIKEQIEQMKNENTLNSGISSHDVHQYSAIYVLLSSAVLAVAVYLCRWVYRRRQRSANLQSDSEAQPARSQHSAPVGDPTPRTRASKQPREEEVELRNFSNLLSSIKQQKRIPPAFVTTLPGDSD